ncbi:hypothetical protein GQ43DRAFT_445993 [Delitschia confertaspora ATCC 74209]|uniref:Folliculin-interacting protein N-terminal domain-containing protein n=1 Tax=Delitschia confertaspora ATCC 74209 TaxID=1513339 RepID=A0A9P4JTG6_9PLEO|nr:hypothetical protein GQ43DRAFT_445993 [Delitschia confertaspora ATCC 74209]
MDITADMIGQFFGGRKGAGSSHHTATTTLDSTTEESHTRHLLFPDTHSLSHPEGQPYPLYGAPLTSGSGYDGAQGEIDLECPRDIRIIIAQDELGPCPKTILFDSKPRPSAVESPTQTSARSRLLGGIGVTSTAGPTFGGGTIHGRRSSLVTESTTLRSPTVGAFTRTRTRGNSISSMPNIDEHSQAQAQAQAQARAKEPSVDLAKICLDCMFGNTPMNYRGIGNKLHIVPLDTRTSDPATSPTNLHDATNSLGRAEGRKRSQLAKSYTPSTLPAEIPRPALGSNGSGSKEPRRRTILITRTFSVAPPMEERDSSHTHAPTPQNSVGKSTGFPFPGTGARGQAKPAQPPQALKTPMYGITMILHLPVAAPMPPPSRPGNPKPGGPVPSSVPGNESLGSSLDSDSRAGWAFVDPSFGVESFLSTLNSDVDDRVDVIGQHWDVITRTLTSLQFVVQERILARFRAQETSSSPVIQQPRGQLGRYASREMPVQQPRRALRLQPNALALDEKIKEAIQLAQERAVRGMKIPRVVTGQGKWGVWREEARWLGRWAGHREENFFFYNLLTAFLGNHTEWLDQLGPKWYRKRHREQQKANGGEFVTISSRTVIVSPDKMAARRLIFLLAAFLPTNTPGAYDSPSPMRPGTSASFRAYSQSPPTNMPLSRKQSLRRTISRRPRGKEGMTNTGLQPPVLCSASSTPESVEKPDSSVPDPIKRPQHSRASSSHSVRTSFLIPSMSDSAAKTKSSTGTTSGLASQDAAPVAHFTLPRTTSSGLQEHKPESNDSLASANLMHTLQRKGTGHTSTASTDSSGTSRWGSLLSFWSGGRRSSTDHSDILQTTDDGLGISSTGYRGPDAAPSALDRMVQELSMEQGLFGDVNDMERSTDTVTTADSSPEHKPIGGTSGVPASAARPIPERPRAFDSSPLKLSVNEKDGVIDVDIPLPDFGSPLQSPLMGNYASSQNGSSYGESSVLSMPSYEPEQPVNVAGWLSEFHPDFAVQAIKPYDNLMRDIKHAMSAEPTPMATAATPTLEQGPLEKWVDICSALVADTRSFSIKRLRLRRLVRIIPTPTWNQSAMTPGISGVPGRSQYGNPYTASGNGPLMAEVHLQEKFTEELIMDFDTTLVDAVDHILAQSGQPSRVHSASSSRSSSRRGRKELRAETETAAATIAGAPQQVDCKAVLFDALKSVVDAVAMERSPPLSSDAAGAKEGKKGKVPRVRTGADSSLKEGVRRWLAEVE